MNLLMTSTGAYLCILPLQVFWFSSWTPYAVLCNVIFAPLFSLLVVGLGIVLIFLRMLGIPGSEHLLIYHTILIEKILDIILEFYHMVI
jgi:hypothetical protein